MAQTIKKKKANLGPQYDAAIVDSPDSKTKFTSRFKGQSFTPKVTSPGVITIPIGKAQPARPQSRERMGVGGRITPMARKAKNRRAVAESNPRDPGPNPMASTKVNYLTPDKSAQTGYVKGKGWPESSTGAGKNVKLSDPKPSRKA